MTAPAWLADQIAPSPVAVAEPDDRHAWRLSAACRGMDTSLFFGEPGYDYETFAAPVCRACPVRQACEDDVMGIEAARAGSTRHGFVAGMTPRQRAKLARQRQKKSA